MHKISESLKRWSNLLPNQITLLSKSSNFDDPLVRFIAREHRIASSLLSEIRSDILVLLKLCSGEIMSSNHLRSLLDSLIHCISFLTIASVPKEWLRYKIGRDVTVETWISDLVERISQVEMVCKNDGKFDGLDIWMGGFFMPEAFITASLQYVAQKLSCSLEELHLLFDVRKGKTSNDFTIKRLNIEGAVFEGEIMKVSNEPRKRLEFGHLSWVKRDSMPLVIDIPVYRNIDRCDLLFSASIPASRTSIDASMLVQRGVAFVVCEF